MSQHPNDTVRTHADPADSILLSLARAVAGGGASGTLGGASWPRLDLADPQQREFGDYELLEEIGRGGMGVVYRARQRSLEREVAIKFIADWFADADGVTRFQAEARAAARLLHPNIVPVHEVGSVDGLHYFSMPLIRGRSLASVLDHGGMPTRDAIDLLLKLCDAIDYAHRLGLLHLDLKPANVLLDARNEPQVADFGLARHMDDKGGVDAQEVSGTPSYMAPEQILIRQYRLTPATDIYALGAIAYRCLTGASPHGEGNADDVIRRAAAGRIRPPRELDPKIPRDLDAICMKCLELQPSDRYASVAQLADDLRRARDGLPVSVRRIGMIERAQRWFRREPKFAFVTAFAALALVLGAAATSWQWRQAAAQRDAARVAQAEAAAQRDRAGIASEIGAHLFAYKGDEHKRADDLIGWLRKRLPGDENRQSDSLATFMASVDAENPDDAALLMTKIVAVLGSGYRRQMIHALESGTRPHRHLYAVLLTYNDSISQSGDDGASDAGKAFATALKAAIAEDPADPFTWQIAAVYCVGPDDAPDCRDQRARAAERLAKLDPDNMYSWVLVATTTTDARRQRDALHQAARSKRYDDYLGATYATYARAFEVAAVPPPPLIARALLVIEPKEDVKKAIAYREALQFPLAAFSALVTQCGVKVGVAKITDPLVRADCLVIGERMMRSDGGLLARMIGVALVKSLAAGRPEAGEATRIRRLYEYLDQVGGGMRNDRRTGYTSTQLLRDIASSGEMVALQRRARFLGYPDQPPVDWKPDDPMSLQSSRERYDSAVALDRNAALLVSNGRYAEAVTLLEPARKGMGERFGNGWLLVRYLTTLGKARTGLRDFPAAYAALSDAWAIAGNFGPGSSDARDCAQAMVDLYTAWDVADAGKGYDLKASEWRQTLTSLQSTNDD